MSEIIPRTLFEESPGRQGDTARTAVALEVELVDVVVVDVLEVFVVVVEDERVDDGREVGEELVVVEVLLGCQ